MLDDQSPLDIPPFLKIAPQARLKAWRGVPLTHVHPEHFEPPETERVRLEERELKTKARIAKMLIRQEVKQSDSANRRKVRACGATFYMRRATYERIMSELPTSGMRRLFERTYGPPQVIPLKQPKKKTTRKGVKRRGRKAA
jgi:hypothetical protein